MRILEKTIYNNLIVVLIGIIFLIGTISVAGDEGDTLVYIDPSSQNVSIGDTFIVTISCIPSQPIKAYEIKLSFDPLYLEALSVTKGNIFNDFQTFFNPGTIDNSAGTIVDIYDLILGSGIVTNPGTFITISFKAKDVIGASSLDIYNLGVTDEFDYISIDVSNGSVTVQSVGEDPPEEEVSPETPLTPSGPDLVELGQEYKYQISTFDLNGDQIRFKFDWGDGNFSDWSEFVLSNISIEMSHFWNSKSTYAVRAIAQDDKGLNSGWSPALNVKVSKIQFKGKSHINEFNIPINLSVNQLIAFNASDIFNESKNIKSYYWDFGDGKNDTDLDPFHIYESPGEYTVTLVVTDDNGNTYSKNINITINDENIESVSHVGDEKTESIDNPNINSVGTGMGIWILLITLAILGSLFGFFIDKY